MLWRSWVMSEFSGCSSTKAACCQIGFLWDLKKMACQILNQHAVAFGFGSCTQKLWTLPRPAHSCSSLSLPRNTFPILLPLSLCPHATQCLPCLHRWPGVWLWQWGGWRSGADLPAGDANTGWCKQDFATPSIGSASIQAALGWLRSVPSLPPVYYLALSGVLSVILWSAKYTVLHSTNYTDANMNGHVV